MNYLTTTVTPGNVWRAEDGTLLARLHFDVDRYVILKLKSSDEAAFLAANLGKPLCVTLEPDGGM
jgi:hypothetical protein